MDGLERWLVPLPSQHSVGPALCRPHCITHSYCPMQVVREGPRCVGVERRMFLRSSCIPSLSRIGEHFRLAYDPQMLPSIMEVLNSIEDQTIRMVAPASKTDDAIPPTEILPRLTGGVSFVRRSCRRLFSPLLRVSVCTNGMAGNNYVLSGHFFSQLFLAIH